MNVLLVEDNPTDVLFLRDAMSEVGASFDLAVVDDGEKALRYLAGEPPYADSPRPDLVLLDLNLPKVDGEEVLTRVKESRTLRRIPVVIMSTSSVDCDIERCYDLHANAYVVKSHDYRRIVRAIDDFWGRVAERATPVT